MLRCEGELFKNHKRWRQMQRSKPIEILLVDDDPAHVRLTMEVIKGCKIRNNVTVMRNGEEALNFLFKRPPFEDRAMPDLIMLDLNIPKKSGLEVIKEIRQGPEIKNLPVIVLTTSDDAKDIETAYKLGANCYITKPVDLNQFINVINCIEEFWLTIVKLPTRVQ
jgi:CheY-like chemotaxis protein